MTLKDLTVPMPQKKITYKTGTNGTWYVYYTLRAYRNKNGRPTSDVAAIGKKDQKTGRLIPNRRYYEIFQEDECAGIEKAVPDKVRSVGNSVVFMEMAQQTGLSKILEECFPSRWNQIMASSCYMLCEGNVMMYMEDWFDETRVDFSERMNDIDCSKLFASITEEERSGFFRSWVKYRGEREYIVYDVSSISTYSEHIDIAEWGYNRDQDNLPQINLGLYYGFSSHMPVYYNLYSGSIPDKTYLDFMMSNARDLGIRDVCFVMDRGFVTENNFLSLRKKNYSFITALPGQRLDALKLIDENRGEIRKSANRISAYDVYGLKCPVEIDGMNLQAHLYYDPEKQVFDEKELYARIEKLRAELEKINQSKRVTKKYRDYFVIAGKAPEKLVFELNTDKVDAKLERSGFFILLSSKPDLTSAEVLKIYRSRDVIEKSFDEFKNHLDFRRIRTHWNKTTEGKMFVGFLALIMRSYMRRMIKNHPLTKHLTFEKVLIELRKIRSVTLTDRTELLIPLTKQQKSILSVLGISEKLLESPCGT